jgi:hypothetical protein
LSFLEKTSLTGAWSGQVLKRRFVAAGLHLLAGFAVALCVTIPLVFWLYPSPFFEASGGAHLLLLILLVDVVLGPLLTFLVFDERKKSLKKDIAFIIGVQLLALVYGLYATALSRPVYMTYVVDRFETVSAAEADPKELALAPDGFKEIAWGHPKIAYAKRPEDQEKRNEILLASIHGVDIKQLFRYYRPIEEVREQILSRAKTIDELKKLNGTAEVDKILNLLPSSDKLLFVPLQGKKRDLTALINSQTGQLVKVVDLKPW